MKWNWPLIRREIFRGLDKVCKFGGDEKITSISCDSWAQDFGLIDKSGELIFSPVSYRDGRSDGMLEEISKTIGLAELHKGNGSSLSPITTLCQLKAMSAKTPELLCSAASLLHVANLVNFELCGIAACDWAMATASQLWNIGRDDWDFELLKMLGIPSHFLSKVVRKPEIIGYTRHPDFSGIPVVSTEGHDTAAASAVLYPLEKGTLFLSLGSWAMLGCSLGENFDPADYPDADEMGFIGLAYGKWGVFRGVSGLWTLQQCRKEWLADGIDIAWDKLSKDAERSSIGSVIDLTDESLFAPAEMIVAVSELCRKSAQEIPQVPGDYARIICRSLACMFNDDIKRLSEFTGLSFDKLYIMSGGGRNSFLCDEIAAETGLKIIKGPAEASAAGNILLQAIASGIIKTDNEIRKVASSFFRHLKGVP
jgi:rhamnulokinase